MTSCDVVEREEEKLVYRSIFSWTLDDFNEKYELHHRAVPDIVSPPFQTWWQDTFVINLRCFVHFDDQIIMASPNLEVVNESFHRNVDENSTRFHITAFLDSQEGVTIFYGPPNSPPDICLNLRDKKSFSLKLGIKIEVMVDGLSCLVQPSSALLSEEQFQNLEENDPFFDLIIRVGEIQLKANKLTLSKVSPVFYDEIRNPFKEGKIDVVDVENFDVDTVKSFLIYVHTLQRPEFKDIMSAIELYRMSEQYQVHNLKNLCATHIASCKGSTKTLLDMFVSMKI